MPFLKWTGSKSQVLHIFKDYFPNFNKINGYIEPFIGGGSVYFYIMENYGESLQGKPRYISDINVELINCYRVIRDNVEKLIPELEKHQDKDCEKYFYQIRNIYPPGDKMNNIEKAAAFIYLSKVSFGNLWRVNSEGKMNASYCFKKLKILNEDLNYYSKLLKDTNINVMSFENVLKFKKLEKLEGYFVYIDPPYYDLGNNSFTGYTKDGYHLTFKTKLPNYFKELDRRGANVMMSNADTSYIRNTFKDFNIYTIQTNRFTGISFGDGYRTTKEHTEKLSEIVVTNYENIRKQKNIEDSFLSFYDNSNLRSIKELDTVKKIY